LGAHQTDVLFKTAARINPKDSAHHKILRGLLTPKILHTAGYAMIQAIPEQRLRHETLIRSHGDC